MREIPLVDDPWRVIPPSSDTLPNGFDELLGGTWLGVQPGGASSKALARLSEQFAIRLPTVHQYFEFSVALALVTANQGIALLPALALTPPVLPGIQIAMLAGLGHRQLLMRYRESAAVLAEAASELARHQIAQLTG